jgi:hypothetical protein
MNVEEIIGMTIQELFSCDRDIVDATVAMMTLLDLGSL